MQPPSPCRSLRVVPAQIAPGDTLHLGVDTYTVLTIDRLAGTHEHVFEAKARPTGAKTPVTLRLLATVAYQVDRSARE